MKAISKIFGKSRSKSINQQNGSLSQSISTTNLAPQTTEIVAENATKSNTLENRRLTQASINSSSDITHSSSSSSSHSKSPDESLDIKEKLEGQLPLKITIKHLNECIKLPVDRSKPLLDILVMIAAKYSFNPANYIINIESDTKQFTKTNSNPVGLLGADHVVIMPKPKNLKARPSSVPFNWTRRFRVYLPRKQQTVLRILVTEKFRELKFKICEEKSLDPYKYILVKHFQEGQQPELIDLDKTPDDYGFNYKDLQLISVEDYEQLLKQFTSNSRFNHSISLYIDDDHDHHSGSNRLNAQSTNDWSRSTPNINISLKPMKQSDACSVASSRNVRHYKKKPAPPPPPSAAAISGKINGARSVQNLSVISDENEDNCSNITEPSRTPTLSKMYSSFESSKTNNSDLIGNSNETIIKSQPITCDNNNIVSSRSRLTRQNSGSDSSGYCETLLSNTPTDSNSPEPPPTTATLKNSPTSSELKRNGIVTDIGNSDIVVNNNKERKLLVQEKPIPKTRHSKLTSSLSPVPNKLSSSSFKNGQNNSKKRRAPLPPTIRSISTSGQQQQQQLSNDSTQGNSLDSCTSDNQGERVESPCTVTSEELSPHSLSSDVSYTTTASASLSDEQSSVDNENNKTISSLKSSTPTIINNDGKQDDNLDGKLEIQPQDGDIVVAFQKPLIENEPQEKKQEIIANNQQQNLINKESSNSSPSDANGIVEVNPQKSSVTPIDEDHVEIVPNNPATKTTELKSNESNQIQTNQINQQDIVAVHDEIKSNVPEKSSAAATTKNDDEGNKVKPSATGNSTNTSAAVALVVEVDVHHQAFDHCDVPKDNKIQDLTSETITTIRQEQEEEQLQPKETTTNNLNPIDHHRTSPFVVEDKVYMSPVCKNEDLNKNNTKQQNEKKEAEEETADKNINLNEEEEEMKNMNGNNPNGGIVVITDWKRRSSSTLTTSDNNNNHNHNGDVAAAISSTSSISNGGGDHEQLEQNSRETLENKNIEKQVEITLNELNETLDLHQQQPSPPIQNSKTTLTTSAKVTVDSSNGDHYDIDESIGQRLQQQRQSSNRQLQKNPSFIGENINHCIGNDVDVRRNQPHYQSASSLKTSTSSISSSSLGRTKVMINNSMNDNNCNNVNGKCSPLSSNSFSVRDGIRKFNTVNEKNVSQQDLSSLRIGGGSTINTNILRRSSSRLSNNGDDELFAPKVTRKLTNFQIGSFKSESSVDIYERSTSSSSAMAAKPPISNVTKRIANINPKIIHNNNNSVNNRIYNNHDNKLNNGPKPSSSSMPNKTIVSINSSKQQVSNGNGGGDVGFIKPKYAKSISVDVMENNNHNCNNNNNNNNDIKQEQKVHVNQAIAINPKTTIIKNDKSTATTIPINTNGYVNGSAGFMINNKSHNQQPQQQKMLPNFLQELKTKSQTWGQNRNGNIINDNDNILMENNVESLKKQINGNNDQQQFQSAAEVSSQNYSNHLNNQKTQVSNGQMSPKVNGVAVMVKNKQNNNHDVVDGVSNSSPAPPPPPPPPPSSIFSINSSVDNRSPLSSNLIAPKGWQQNKLPETSSQQIHSPLRSVSMDSANQKQQNGSVNGSVNSRDALLNEIKKFHSNSKLKKVANNQPFCAKFN